MELILFFLLAGAALAGLWSRFEQNDKRLQAWRDAAALYGLQVVEVSGWTLKARAGRMDVRIETGGDNQSKVQPVRIVVTVPGPLDFCNVRIRPEGLLEFQAEREIEIGDGAFDATFFIEGPVRLVLALLDAEMRRLLLRLNAESRMEIFIGALRADISGEKVPSVLPLLLEISQRLAESMDVPRRLAENAKGDPEAGVRLQNLLLLMRELPGEPATVEALRAACSDPSPEVRLRAAKELGAESRDVLLELTESLVDDTLGAEAVSALGRELPFERANALLDHASRSGRLRTARACLEVLGQIGTSAAVDLMVKVIEREEGDLATTAVEALGAIGNPSAEPSLLLALGREPEDLRVAAANALGRAGSAAAVLPLKEVAERFWLDLKLRRATRQAIAEIQSRLEGASPGQLSLAEAEAGRLSLAPDPAGQLSLTPEPGRSE